MQITSLYLCLCDTHLLLIISLSSPFLLLIKQNKIKLDMKIRMEKVKYKCTPFPLTSSFMLLLLLY